MTITMPHITDDPELLLDPTQITAALKAAVIYRVTESTSKDGVYTREITANDGRYDGEKKDELARYRKIILQKDEENRLIKDEKRATDADNAKLLCENNQLFNDAEAKDKKISDLERANAALQIENEKLRQKAIKKQEEHQTEKRDMKNQLVATSRDLQSQNDRNRDRDANTEKLKKRIKILEEKASEAEDHQRNSKALEIKLAMLSKSYAALDADKKQTEDKLAIAEYALENSRDAANTALTNERPTQTDPEPTDKGKPQVQDSTVQSPSKTTPQTHAGKNSDMRHESTTTATKSRCRCDEPRINDFCRCSLCRCNFNFGNCLKEGYESNATEEEEVQYQSTRLTCAKIEKPSTGSGY